MSTPARCGYYCLLLRLLDRRHTCNTFTIPNTPHKLYTTTQPNYSSGTQCSLAYWFTSMLDSSVLLPLMLRLWTSLVSTSAFCSGLQNIKQHAAAITARDCGCGLYTSNHLSFTTQPNYSSGTQCSLTYCATLLPCSSSVLVAK